MVDLTEFCGEDALRASITKKRDRLSKRISEFTEKHNAKVKPLIEEMEKYNALLRVMDEHDAATQE